MKYLKILSILFVFCFVFTLSACNYENQSNAPPENEIENPTNEDKNENEGNKMNIKISNTIFEVVLENNTTTTAFVEMLPLSLEMSELNANEKYCYLNSSLPTNAKRVDKIYAGDIMLWGNNCVVIFYETFSSGYSYSKIGKITDTTLLKQCVGSGSIKVDFIK